MTAGASRPIIHRFLSKRRAALFATVALLGVGAIFGDLGAGSKSVGTAVFTPAHAQSAQRMGGFADIVEKVKPAVVSVKVRMNANGDNPQLRGDNPLRGSPFEDFFRRFGQQDGSQRFGFGQPDGGQRFGFGQPDGGQRFGFGRPDDEPRSGRPGRPDGDRPSSRPERRQFSVGQGSGFFISADGYAVTNNHVVDKADRVEVTADDGRTFSARVIGTDQRTDVALIKVDGRNDFPYVRFADKSPRIGDWVLAVGNPFGLGGTVTAGIVSARGRDIGAGPYDDFIQIDAAVNRGNSGGPTFDVDGNVIGVNTAIFSPSGGNVGIAFDIPADTVKTVVAQLKDRGAVTRGWIGVQIQPVTAELADSLGMNKARGALVAEPQSGSPAQKAGIRAGDVIVSVNGDPIEDARALARRISSLAPGTSVKLGVIRNGREDTVTLILGEMPREREARAG